MLIAIISNNVVSRVGHYKELFPNEMFPDAGPSDVWLQNHSCMRVNVFKPHDRETQLLASSDPYIEGDWVYTVVVRNMTEAEKAAYIASKAAQKRADRDRALQASDWRVIRASETGVAMDQEWVTYRQALRDLPNTEGWPNVDLPRDPDYVEPEIQGA